MEPKRVGMIGLGLMGTAMTERLLSAGYEVWGYDLVREKAEPLLARGAHWAENPLAVCDRVIISLYTTETVEAMLRQLGGALRPEQILIDTTTGSPEQTAGLGERLAADGVHYLDAPISGSSEQTRRGDVTVLVGGQRQVFQACCDLFRCFAKNTIHVGPVGSGARMKLVSNLVLGLNRAALAEGLVFAQAIGLDAHAALEVLIHTMAYSRTMDTKGKKMVEGDFSTQARLSQHLKDVRLILQAAAEAGQPLPLSETHGQLLEAAQAAGLGEADNSAIIQAVRQYQQHAGTNHLPRFQTGCQSGESVRADFK
jgi:3-hydroxyisobutyrate dehydrogenase-like beta-hydroxyacid dehydrogenase